MSVDDQYGYLYGLHPDEWEDAPADSHGVTRCRECMAEIGRCACDPPHRWTRYGVCEACKR